MRPFIPLSLISIDLFLVPTLIAASEIWQTPVGGSVVMVREIGAGFGRRSAVRTMTIATLGHLVPAGATRVIRGLSQNLDSETVAFL